MEQPNPGAIGVILSDTRQPPRLYELDTVWGDGEVCLVLVGDHARMYTRHCHISEFWPLLDRMPA